MVLKKIEPRVAYSWLFVAFENKRLKFLSAFLVKDECVESVRDCVVRNRRSMPKLNAWIITVPNAVSANKALKNAVADTGKI